MKNNTACPCGTGIDYQLCCEVYHKHVGTAPSAEVLMRSRYSAYAKHLSDYIYATFSPHSRAQTSSQDIAQSNKHTLWLNLEIVSCQNESPNTGQVEFIATGLSNKQFFRMHETSDFLFEDGQWFYTTGKIWHDSGEFSLGRNEPCPCNSGKKVKRCCMLKC